MRVWELSENINHFQWKYDPDGDKSNQLLFKVWPMQSPRRIGKRVKRFLVLLWPFVETTKRMEGNADSGGFEGSREALLEIFISIQVLSDRIDKALSHSSSRTQLRRS